MSNIEPVVYTVDDIRTLLGIGRTRAYILVNSKVFPTLRIGRRILVTRQNFEEWLHTEPRSTEREITERGD